MRENANFSFAKIKVLEVQDALACPWWITPFFCLKFANFPNFDGYFWLFRAIFSKNTISQLVFSDLFSIK